MTSLSVHTSAAGKALILGEYAVLYGHPALVLALERQIHCRIQPHDDAGFRLLATPLLQQAQGFEFDDVGSFVWRDPGNQRRLPFIEPLFNMLEGWPEILSGLCASNNSGIVISFDSSEFFHHNGNKLGLGSSAALTVALFKAWYELRYPHSKLDTDQWLNNLVNMHRNLQAGQGSGADIAASLYGGLLSYCITSNGKQGIRAAAQAQQWPVELEVIWIWLGKSSSTRHMIEDIELFRRTQPHAHRQHIEQLAAISRAGIDAVQQGSGNDLQQALAAYGEAMQNFGLAAEADIYTEDHRRLAAMAKASGIAFKPSGAGGGDIALAAATDTMALVDFARQCRAAGYELLA